MFCCYLILWVVLKESRVYEKLAVGDQGNNHEVLYWLFSNIWNFVEDTEFKLAEILRYVKFEENWTLISHLKNSSSSKLCYLMEKL